MNVIPTTWTIFHFITYFLSYDAHNSVRVVGCLCLSLIHSHLYLFMISNDFKEILYKFIILYKNNNEVFLTSLLLTSYSFHNVLFDGNHMCFL